LRPARRWHIAYVPSTLTMLVFEDSKIGPSEAYGGTRRTT
jgi:hypothetical protein